jgi:hypothetical protein
VDRGEQSLSGRKISGGTKRATAIFGYPQLSAQDKKKPARDFSLAGLGLRIPIVEREAELTSA